MTSPNTPSLQAIDATPFKDHQMWLRGLMIRYSFAAVAAVACTGFTVASNFIHDSHLRFIVFYPAVLLVGLCAGFVPGVVCIVLSIVGLGWLSGDFARGSSLSQVSGIIGFATFALLSFMILCLAAAQRRARARIQEATEAARNEAHQLEQEVAERIRIGAALAQSESGLARAQRIARLGSWELHLASNRFTWSDEVYQILGIERTQSLPTMQDFMHAMHPEDRDQVIGVIDEAVRENATFNVDHRVVRPDGTQRVVNQQGEMALDASGRPARLLAAMLDITDRHRFEQTLRASEIRTRMIIDSALDAVVLSDSKGVISSWNAQAERMFGWTREEAIGRRMAETILPPSSRSMLKKDFRQFLTSGAARLIGRRTELLALHKNGSEFPVELSIAPVELYDTVLFSAFVRDISDRKRSDEALRSGTEMQKLLLSELNHRVRNNLAGLISLIDLSATSAADIPTFAATISNRVHSMAAVHSMLSHSSWGSLSISDLVHRLAPTGRRGKVCAQGPAVEVPAHQCTAFGMVIGELMANSLKYGALSADHGIVEVRWHVEDAANCDANRIRLTWIERGGPAIEHDPEPHVGTNLIKGFVKSDLRGHTELSYPRSGAAHALYMTFDTSHQALLAASK